MKPVFQRQGDDCMRAAVASVLERDYEDVWNFMERRDADGRWWGWHVDEWLRTEGYPFRLGMWNVNPNVPLKRWHIASFWLGEPWWIALMPSSTLHAVVMHGNELAHDPLPAGLPKYEIAAATYFYVPEPWTVDAVQAVEEEGTDG